jgi:hypothetical protein
VASLAKETHLVDVRASAVLNQLAAVPLLPGTRAIYSVKGSCFPCVGFRGYEGGLEASAVREERDLASIAGTDMTTTDRNC